MNESTPKTHKNWKVNVPLNFLKLMVLEHILEKIENTIRHFSNIRREEDVHIRVDFYKYLHLDNLNIYVDITSNTTHRTKVSKILQIVIPRSIIQDYGLVKVVSCGISKFESFLKNNAVFKTFEFETSQTNIVEYRWNTVPV